MLIAETRLPSLHKQLAQALEKQPGADLSEQARHWDRAQDREHALLAYRRAADQALSSLAFAHAEKLYERCASRASVAP